MPRSATAATMRSRAGETPSPTRETRVLSERKTGEERERERNVEHRTSNIERRMMGKKRRFKRGRRRGRRGAEE